MAIPRIRDARVAVKTEGKKNLSGSAVKPFCKVSCFGRCISVCGAAAASLSTSQKEEKGARLLAATTFDGLERPDGQTTTLYGSKC